MPIPTRSYEARAGANRNGAAAGARAGAEADFVPEAATAQKSVGVEPGAAAACPLALPALIESILFVADEPVSEGQLAQVLEVDADSIAAALDELAANYHAAGGRGIRLQRKNDRVQLISAPEAAPVIERFLGVDLGTSLSSAALETLAVIAYRQPLTRGDIEGVRGVNCDAVLRTLISHGLVEPAGRLEQPGRPFVYGTTFQFLQYFGLEGLHQLPPLPGSEEAQLSPPSPAGDAAAENAANSSGIGPTGTKTTEGTH